MTGCARFGLSLFRAGCFIVALPCVLAEETQSPRPPTPVNAPVRDQERVFEQHVTSWVTLRRKNVVMQQRDYSCGAASLATLLRYHWGDPVTETQCLITITKMLTLEEMKERIKNGLSLTDLRRLAVELGGELQDQKQCVVTHQSLMQTREGIIEDQFLRRVAS